MRFLRQNFAPFFVHFLNAVMRYFLQFKNANKIVEK